MTTKKNGEKTQVFLSIFITTKSEKKEQLIIVNKLPFLYGVIPMGFEPMALSLEG